MLWIFKIEMSQMYQRFILRHFQQMSEDYLEKRLTGKNRLFPPSFWERIEPKDEITFSSNWNIFCFLRYGIWIRFLKKTISVSVLR